MIFVIQINVRENRKGNQELNGQSRDTGSIGYTRLRTKTNKAKNKTQKTKKMNNTDSTKNGK